MRSTVTDPVAWSVCWSVCHSSEPCKNSWTDLPFGLRTQVGPGNHVLDGRYRSPMRRGNFEGGKVRPIVKYRTLCGHLCKNGWIDHHAVLTVISEWPKESWIRWRFISPMRRGNFGERVARCKVQGLSVVSSTNVWTNQFDVWVVDSGGLKEA